MGDDAHSLTEPSAAIPLAACGPGVGPLPLRYGRGRPASTIRPAFGSPLIGRPLVPHDEGPGPRFFRPYCSALLAM